MSTAIVLASSADAGVVRRWLESRARLVDEVVRGHSELSCMRYAIEDGSEIAVLEDHVGDVAYVTLPGSAAATWAAAIGKQVRVVGTPAVLAKLGNDADPRQWIRALSQLALLRGDQSEPALVHAWSRALSHPHTAVRRAAIRTCYGSRWPELRALVLRRVGVDTDLRRPLELLANHLAGLVPL